MLNITIRKTQIKPEMRYYLIPVRIATRWPFGIWVVVCLFIQFWRFKTQSMHTQIGGDPEVHKQLNGVLSHLFSLWDRPLISQFPGLLSSFLWQENWDFYYSMCIFIWGQVAQGNRCYHLLWQKNNTSLVLSKVKLCAVIY